MYYIYILKCPLTLKIRYVGQTKMKLGKRLSGHIYESKKNKYRHSHKENWIIKLSKLNLKPIIEEIEKISNVDLLFVLEREKYWISKFKNDGLSLVNATNGGEYSINNKIVITSQKGNMNPMWGKKHNKETKIIMRNKKIGLYSGINNPRSRPIYQYDKNLFFIKKWDYAKECSDFYKFSRGNISNAAKLNLIKNENDKFIIRYGFIFSFIKI